MTSGLADDLAGALAIGRTELERKFGSSADDWVCDQEWDELRTAWILYVDRVDFYKTRDAALSRPGTPPIVIAKRDAAVTRPFGTRQETGRLDRIAPDEDVIAQQRVPDGDTERLPDAYFYSSVSPVDLERWIRPLRWFRFVRCAPRDNAFDEFAACFRWPDEQQSEHHLRAIGVERRPLVVRSGTHVGELPLVHYVGDRLVFADWRDGVLRVSVSTQLGEGDEPAALAAELERRMAEDGWEEHHVETTGLDPRCVVTPTRYPELFAPPPYGPLD